MKKLLCLLLAMLLCPLALAEENAAGVLGFEELNTWAEDLIARAYQSEPLNDPAASLSEEGYEYIYDFATLYADTPSLSADTTVSAIVVTSEEELGPRNVKVGAALEDVLNAYYTENPNLSGTKENAVLYAVDLLPASAAWAQVLRDGQRIQTVQYAVHEQLPTGGAGYTDAGVIYTMAENRVSAIRAYGLNSRVSQDEVSSVLFTMMMEALFSEYAQVPFSYDGLSLTAFGMEDTVFSGLDFLHLHPHTAAAVLGEPMNDTWLENGDDGYIRVQKYAGCEVTWLFNQDRTEGKVYMLQITADGLEGPRAVRIGDSFQMVYNRFRNGEGEYQEDGSEVLYGEGSESFGTASYGNDASAVLRYGFTAANGRKVVLQLHFTVMELTEILLYCD